MTTRVDDDVPLIATISFLILWLFCYRVLDDARFGFWIALLLTSCGVAIYKLARLVI